MSSTSYNEEMRLQTVKLVLKGDKSAAKIAKELERKLELFMRPHD